MKKNCYLFGVTHCAHESESKNSISNRQIKFEKKKIGVR